MTDLRTNETPAAGETPEVDQGRRAAIARMGGIAAPALVVLLTADASEAWAASGRPRPFPKPKPKPKPRPPVRPRRVVGGIVRRFL